MTAVYILLALALALGAANIGALIYFGVRRRGGGSVTRSELISELEAAKAQLKNDVRDSVKYENAMLTGVVNQQIVHTKELIAHSEATANSNSDKVDRLSKELTSALNELKLAEVSAQNELKASIAEELGKVKDFNAASMKELRDTNDAQLEKMRKTVDEKLETTLDARFKQSFQIVNDRLEEINRAAKELQNLQSGVKDLTKVFQNVKTRGTWGEVSLAALLEQILAPEQYAAQVRLKKGKGEAVDFVIHLQNGVVLPIDSKFPLEAYQRLVLASENGDRAGVERESRALADAIKVQARFIRDKYIDPPVTTDFAVMYLPTEGLYAEVVRNTTLVEELRNTHHVIVCGPTTFAALLNSLQMGFRSLAVAKHSREIGKLFNAFIKDFKNFEDLLLKTRKNIDTVGRTIDDAEKRTKILRAKLDKVYELTKGDFDEQDSSRVESDAFDVPEIEYSGSDFGEQDD